MCVEIGSKFLAMPNPNGQMIQADADSKLKSQTRIFQAQPYHDEKE